jgi:hypothetical protein
MKRLLMVCALFMGSVASAQAQAALQPRAFGVVRLGPIGRTVVHANTREVSGVSTPAPGLGARLDAPVLPALLLGVDLGLLFEGESELRPQSPSASYELQAEGLILDALFSARPVWRLAHERLELHASAGVGLSFRPSTSLSGSVAHGMDAGSTASAYPSTSGLHWGVLAQLGLGGTFWLSRRFAVFIECALLARQTHATIEDPLYGDYLLQMTDTQGVLLAGFGASLGGR